MIIGYIAVLKMEMKITIIIIYKHRPFQISGFVAEPNDTSNQKKNKMKKNLSPNA